MAEIYQIPEKSGGGIPFSIPIGGNGGGLFGGNGGSLVDLFGFAIIASMFGWGNGGFGGNGGNIANQLNNDAGRELIMNSVMAQGEAQRSAIQGLATMIGQDFNLVNAAVMNVQNTLNTIANSQGVNALQIINAIQAGNASIISQFQQCCCQNQLAIERQTNTLQAGANANTQSILNKLSEMQTQALQDKLDAARAENTKLAGEISQAQQNSVFANVVANAVTPLNAQLAGIRAEVDAIKRCQPSTITIPDNSMTAVPTLWATAVADNIVDKLSTVLNGSTTTTTTGGGTGA